MSASRRSGALLLVVLAGCGDGPKTPRSYATSSDATPNEPTRHVALTDEQRTSLAIATARLEPRSQSAQARAMAVVVEDPASSFTLRAPIAGTWTSDDASPGLGRIVAAGAIAGRIAPRLSAVESTDARARLATARGEVDAATASLEASRRAKERVEALNAADKNASDRAVEEARAKLAGDTARLAAARETVAALEAVLDPARASNAAVALTIGLAGEVVEVLARPGEELQAGAPILRVADLAHPLVRVLPPPTLARREAPAHARIQDPFDAEAGWTASFVAPDPSAKEAVGAAWLYRLDANPSGRLRPGTTLVARIDEGAPRAGFRLPHTSIVRVHGATWVYLADGKDAFERVAVAPERSADGEWFVTEEWASSRDVVVTGAHALLTAELSSTRAGSEED